MRIEELPTETSRQQPGIFDVDDGIGRAHSGDILRHTPQAVVGQAIGGQRRVGDAVLEAGSHRHGGGLSAHPVLQLLRVVGNAVSAAQYERIPSVQSAIREAQAWPELLPVRVHQLLRKTGVLVTDEIAAEALQRGQDRG